MRKIALILALVISGALFAASSASSGQGHAFEVTIGSGYASLGYKANNLTGRLESKTTGSYALQAHIGYNWFFSRYMGLAIGVDAHHYGQNTALDGLLSWDGVTDTDGELYEHILELKQWTERQECWTVEIPLSFVFSIPVSNVLNITAQVGAKYGLPLSATYSGHGTLTHTGYYEPWGLTLSDKPNHGFYTEENFRPKGQLPHKNYWTVFAKVGIALPLTEQLDMMIQIYANYAVTSFAEGGQDETIGFRNDRAGQEQNHYFMNDYISLTNTAIIANPLKPRDIGLELGVRYNISRPKPKQPCHCLGVYF